MSAPDLAAQLGMTRQTIHRLLQQLEEIGMIRRELERERFGIGPAFAELGLHALSTGHGSKLRRAVMEELVAKSGETCNLTVLDGHDIVYVDRVECNWPLRRQIEIGGRMPAYCTAGGKLLLALSPRRTLEQYLSAVTLKRLTPNTWTAPEAFRAHLETIRAQDYAINNQENLIGLLAVAVPIRDPSGQVLAALALHGPEARLPESRAHAFVPQLREAADAIGELLVESATLPSAATPAATASAPGRRAGDS